MYIIYIAYIYHITIIVYKYIPIYYILHIYSLYIDSYIYMYIYMYIYIYTYILYIYIYTYILINRMRWKTLQFLGKLDNSEKENYGFKTRKCPPCVDELVDF